MSKLDPTMTYAVYDPTRPALKPFDWNQEFRKVVESRIFQKLMSPDYDPVKPYLKPFVVPDNDTDMTLKELQISEAYKARLYSREGLRLLKKYKMSEEEKEAQVRSFAYGNTHLANPEITREDIDRAADKLARKTDPNTSHKAARSQRPQKLTAIRNLVYCTLKGVGKEGLTHEELCARLPTIPASSVRTRCRELVEQGLVQDSGQRRPTRHGRESIIWRLTEEGNPNDFWAYVLGGSVA